MEESLVSSPGGCLIVLGTALGYHLLPLKESCGFRTVICIDILADAAGLIDKNPCTSFLGKMKNLHILGGYDPEELHHRLNELLDFEELSQISVVAHAPSMRAAGPYYRDAEDAVRGVIQRKAGNSATRRAFEGLYLRNSLKNLEFLPHMYGVRHLFGLLRGYSGVVVTSGPSLNRNLHALKEWSGFLYIIAVDSALPVLNRHGIRADFVVSIDPQVHIMEHIFGAGDGKELWVTTPSAYGIFNRVSGKVFCSLNSHPVAQLLEELYTEQIGSVDSRTGTVAGDALMLAVKLGLERIALLGFDFSFPDFSIYARGSAYQERFGRFFQNRLHPVEEQNGRYIMKASQGLKSGSMLTRRSFLQYCEAMERLIRDESMTGVVQVDGPGLQLGGVPSMSFESFLKGCVQGDRGDLAAQCDFIPPLNDELDTTALLRALGNEDIFTRIIDASLDKSSERKRQQCRALCRSIHFT